MTRYFFFDIDGTLLLSGGAGRVAMMRTMQAMYGLSELNRIEVHGRTDRGIIRDLFDSHDLHLDDTVFDEFRARYHDSLAECITDCPGTLMPGAVEVLEFLNSTANVRLGVLTGNSGRAAHIKLEAYGLRHYFEFGGYGEFHFDRNDVARDALAACREQYHPDAIQPDQVWVVGDTIHDISCARAIGANVIAVATGNADVSLLSQHQPDLVMEDLTSAEAFISPILNGHS
ncbi:MAG: HAD family hydrolase [Pirellulaceae bacterium]